MEQFSKYIPYFLLFILVVGWVYLQLMRRRRRRSPGAQRRSWRDGFRERREDRLRQAETWSERKELKTDVFPPGSLAACLQENAKGGDASAASPAPSAFSQSSASSSTAVSSTVVSSTPEVLSANEGDTPRAGDASEGILNE